MDDKPPKPFTGGLAFEPWTVQAAIRYGDENLFFHTELITIGRLTSDGDAIAVWEKAAGRERVRGDGSVSTAACPSTYAMMAIFQVGRDVFRFDSGCEVNKGLYPYELADLLELAMKNGEKPNPKAVVDYCGDVGIVIDETPKYLEKKRRKTYGGHVMPDDRDAARKKALAAQPDPVAALARAQWLRKELDECIYHHAGKKGVPTPIPITISPAGTVRAVGLGENPPRRLYRCVKWITRKWQFAPQGSEVKIELPAR